jgi:endonuclease/exonuclease/phosphatase family metal-dependent hydrolase
MITLTIGAYNHQGGGIDAGSDERLRRQLDMIERLELDALFSTEATGWFDHGRSALHLAARRLGMQPLWVRAPRHDCNLVIFIRIGRLQVLEERHEQGHPWWHAQARVVAAVDGAGEPLWLVAAHFAPFNPDIRAAEARATAELAGCLAIMGGDWNDEGFGDEPTDWAALPGHEALRHLPAGDESAASILARAGFVDAAGLLLPNRRDRQPTAGIPRAPVRCDRIYVSERLAKSPIAYRVLDHEEQLSDHRLVLAEIALPIK